MKAIEAMQNELGELVWHNWQIVAKLNAEQVTIRKALTEVTSKPWRENEVDPLVGVTLSFEANPNGRDWLVRGVLQGNSEVVLGTVVCQVAPDDTEEPVVIVTAKLPKSPPGGRSVDDAKKLAQGYVNSRKSSAEPGQFRVAEFGGTTKYDIISLRVQAPGSDEPVAGTRRQALVELARATVADFSQIFEHWAALLRQGQLENDTAPPSGSEQ